MRRYVLDANALLTYFGGRQGTTRMRNLLDESLRHRSPILMSAVNWGEVLYSLWKQGGQADAKRAEKVIADLPSLILPSDQGRAERAAELNARHDLGYADSFAAALALENAATLGTADPEFVRIGKRLALLRLPRHISQH